MNLTKLRTLLLEALIAMYPMTPDEQSWGFWIEEIWPFSEPMQVAWWDKDQLYRQNYELNDESVTLVGEREQITVELVYRPDTSQFSKREEDGFVIRTGPLWTAKCYEDRDICFPPDHADKIAKASELPIALDSEHAKSFLELSDKWKQAGITKLWAVENVVWGDVRIPKEIDALFEGKAIPVSIEMAPGFESIVKLAFTYRPADTTAGIFNGHDDKPCKCGGHTNLGSQEPKESQPTPVTGKFSNMNTKTKVLAMFAALGAAGLATHNLTPDEVQSLEFKEPEVMPTERELQFEQQVKALQTGRVTELAKTFAKEQLDAGKITKAQEEGVAVQFALLLKADGGGSTKFNELGDPEEGEGMKAFREHFKNQPATRQYAERLESFANPGGEGGGKSPNLGLHAGRTPQRGNK